MTISIYYDFIAETKSQILSVRIHKNYQILWHCLSKESDLTDTVYQSDVLTQEEYFILIDELKILFIKEGAPEWLMNTLIQHIIYE